MSNIKKLKTFRFGDQINLHQVGNPKCPECWPSYPKLCTNCGGLVHADFGDEKANGDYWLYESCDKCDEAYEYD